MVIKSIINSKNYSFNIKYLYLIFFSFFLLFFSACSNLNNPWKTDNIEIISGEGLIFTYNHNLEWLPGIEYELYLKGDGKDSILIEKENFFLTSTFKKQDGTNVFTQESIDNFYNNLFEKGNLELANGGNKIIKGSLEIDPDIYKNLNLEVFEYIISIFYDYKTDFTNNLVMDLNNKQFTISDKLSQAAPINIYDIDIRWGNSPKILYYVKDSGNSQGEIFISEYNFYFGSNDLSNNCKIYIDDEGRTSLNSNENSIYLSQSQSVLIFSCDLPLENYPLEKLSTQTGGYLKYKYNLLERKKVNLPKNRNLAFE